MLQNKQKNADVLLCMTSGNRYVKSNGLHRTVQRTEKRGWKPLEQEKMNTELVRNFYIKKKRKKVTLKKRSI